VVVADHTKWGLGQPELVRKSRRVDVLVTDDELPARHPREVAAEKVGETSWPTTCPAARVARG